MWGKKGTDGTFPQIDDRGRGGTLDAHAIRYDPKRERFTGTLTRADPHQP